MANIYYIDNKLNTKELEKIIKRNKNLENLVKNSFDNVIFKEKLNYYELISALKLFELLLENEDIVVLKVHDNDVIDVINKNLNILINMLNRYIFRYEIAENVKIINTKEKFEIENKRPYIKDEVSGKYGMVVKGKFYNIYRKEDKNDIEEWKLFFVPLTYFPLLSLKRTLLETILNKTNRLENTDYIVTRKNNTVKIVFKPLKRYVIVNEEEIYSLINIITKIFSYNRK